MTFYSFEVRYNLVMTVRIPTQKAVIRYTLPPPL